MGKPTGFIDAPRRTAPKRAPDERVQDFREFVLPDGVPLAREQAGRCMDCGVPFCHQGCPLGNLIPDWNDLVYRDRWQAAFRSLDETNNFPEFTGRLCPAPCEAACVLAIDRDPVTIEQIEKEIVERAFAEGWITPRPPATRTGKKVAVVGSGPAGLAAAQQLNRAGHHVTLLERDDRLGGLLRYGIPDFKLEKSVIDRRLAILEQEGIAFVTGADIGRAPTWDALRNEYDGLVIAIGARRPRELDIPGRGLSSVWRAMDYLEAQNRIVANGGTSPLDVKGRRVVVLGGGDTGSDCVGTAHRQDAASVMQIELLPAPPEHRTATNPWPQWPMVFRTSSSQEEGGERRFGVLTKRFVDENDTLVGLETVQVEMAIRDGRPHLVELPGTETTIPADVVILALGFTGPETDPLASQLGVQLDARGNVAHEGRFRTNVPGVYVAGDAARGASLIVWAIAEGREAARHLDGHLRGSLSLLPTRGVDRAFGGR